MNLAALPLTSPFTATLTFASLATNGLSSIGEMSVSSSFCGIFLLARTLRIPATMSFRFSTSSKIAVLISLTGSKVVCIIDFTAQPCLLGSKPCQSSSVMNGMNGWSIRSIWSKKASVASYVAWSIGCWYAGLIISKYQPENSSQYSLKMVMSASDRRYLLNRSAVSLSVCAILALNHSMAYLEVCVCSMSATSKPLIRRKQFQILLQKLRPCSQSESSYNISFPAGAERRIPIRTPSAP